MNLSDIKKMAINTKGRLHQLAAGVGREPMIFLHWSAGHYGQDFADYHIRIDKNGEIYGNSDLTAVLAHTWHNNTGAIGLACLCNYNASTVNFGGEPLTKPQIEMMSRVVAVLCQGLGIPCDKKHVQTHAERADLDGYGPATTCERWDLWMLGPGQSRGSGGDILRGKANWYIAHGVGND